MSVTHDPRSVVVVDYGQGNVGSIVNMGRKAGGRFTVSADPTVIAQASKLILPGVGAFDTAMEKLHARDLVGVLNEAVLGRRVPILGICLGVQLLLQGSEEGVRPGLGWIAGRVIRFRQEAGPDALKVPHMGWNYVAPAKPDALLQELPPEPRFYFVHSYHLACDDPSDVLAWTDYGVRFASAVQRENIRGTQFHPEKSHKFGLAVLKNFLAV
jgi:glutamine amidotransferase